MVNLQFRSHSNVVSRAIWIWIVLGVHLVWGKRRTDRTRAVERGAVIRRIAAGL